MAKANIETRDGAKIVIEGTPEEISKVMKLYKDEEVSERPAKELKKFNKQKSNSKPTVIDTIRELLAEGFFNKPKSLAEVKHGLEEQGTFIPITTLSSLFLRLVKGRELRRMKQDKKWVYVKR